jgi:DNA repair protein RecN (Recombination protein N)
VFETGAGAALREWLDEHGVEAEEGMVVLKREVAVEGRNRAWINGSPTTASLLGELGAALVSLHGQHEHQTLLKRDEQRAILDAYASNEPVLERVRGAHRSLRELRRELEEREEKRREIAARADFLRFQMDEIEAAEPRSGEEEALEEEQRRLSHSEELMALSTALADALTVADEALVTQLAGLRKGIEQLVRIDHSQRDVAELFDNAYYTLEDLGNRMAEYAAAVEHDPARLEEIRTRQDLLYRLKSKYGPTLDDVIATSERARAELELVDGAGFETEALRKREAAAREELATAAAELSARRGEAMTALAREVNAVLPELGMAGGRFEAVAVPLAAPGAAGGEEIEFRVTLNKGFDPRPLAQVASGGELSRVMLALKTILARLDAVPTVVFDEVDAGVGGRVALQLGDKLRQVAGSHQVFAITHLPQIASRAHHHLLVRKSERGGITATEVDLLEGEGRVREVARMLGGDPESEVSLRHARELLDRGALAV